MTPWKMNPGTREEQNGGVLANDLIFVAGNGQSAPKQYPQAAVLYWDPVTLPGRYRVTLRARTERFGASTLVLQAWVREEDGGLVLPSRLLLLNSTTASTSTPATHAQIPVPVASIPMSGYAFDEPGKWQTFALEFDVESDKPTTVGLMYVGDKTCEAGTVQVDQSSLELAKVDLPVSISWARPVKLRYKHAEKGALDIRLTNATDQEQTVDVRPVVVTDTDTRIPGQAQRFTVPASATVGDTVPFAVPADDGGYEVIGELLLGGKVIDRHGDVFAVSDSPFRCMIHGEGAIRIPFFLSSSQRLGLAGFQKTVLEDWDQYINDCTVAIETMRRAYVTYHEYFAWAREDATMMTEQTDEPYVTGQTFYIVSRKQLLLLNDLMKRHGIAPLAYTNAVPFGWPGFEVVRRRPEWYREAQFDTAVMEKYVNGETVRGNVYPAIEMNFDVASPIDGKTYLQYHMEQLVASVKQYGWEAFRHDAAPIPLRHFPTVKRALAALDPPVGIGNNQGIYWLGTEPSDAWRIYCQDGSLMMEEDIRSAFHNPTDPRRRWVDYIDYLRQSSHLARSHGAHYTYINVGEANWYSTALGYALGGHPWGFQKSPFGDYERFMIRYGSYFWDSRTQMLPDADKMLSVASHRPLWWKPLASQRVLDPKCRQIVVPLLNPPAEEEVVGATPVGQADGVTVSFIPKAHETVTASLLAPEPVAHRVQLEARTLSGGRVQVTVPRFWSWTNVVFDCRTK